MSHTLPMSIHKLNISYHSTSCSHNRINTNTVIFQQTNLATHLSQARFDLLECIFFITNKHGEMIKRNKSVPHAEARRSQRKTNQAKALLLLLYSAISAPRVSKANGRE